ncbi:MAG: hypothetical protein EZS28_015567 [Streblomastix strix]|uniref:Uncharacterized protein n=1 Tax=Streblomastix strix TaxID=222440 RepID=A0A5J4W1Z8_9EUKA|nr:MAG: hypothetical protein EZS28_015567 [Streblomastix strix]
MHTINVPTRSFRYAGWNLWWIGSTRKDYGMLTMSIGLGLAAVPLLAPICYIGPSLAVIPILAIFARKILESRRRKAKN